MTVANGLIIIWTVAMGIVSYFTYDRLVNPVLFMNLIWCICTTFSTLGLFSFYIPEEKTYVYVLIFLITYTIFSLAFHSGFRRIKFKFLTMRGRKKGSDISNDLELHINVTLLAMILLCLALLILPSFVKSIKYVLSGNLVALRTMFLSDADSLFGQFMSYFYSYIIRPYIVFLDILAAYAVGKNYTQKWRLFTLAAVGSLIHVVLTAGRMLIFELGCYILISLLLYKPRTKGGTLIRLIFNRWSARITSRSITVLLFSIPVIIGVVYVTSFRADKHLGIFGTFWQYSIGTMSYLDIVVNEPAKFGIVPGQYLYGKATFGFITGVFSTLLSVFTGADYQGADYLTGLFTERFYHISPHVSLNATATILYPFLRDWGFIGLFIGPAIVALLVEFVYHKAVTINSLSWNLVLIAMYYMILFSVWRYTLMIPTTYMSFVWIAAFSILNNSSNKLNLRGKQSRKVAS